MNMKCMLFSSVIAILISFSPCLGTAQEEKAEEAINLDDLKEDPGDAEAGDQEKLLPVSGTIIEVERHPAVMILALVVLAPAATLLVRPKRARRKTHSLEADE